MKILNPCCVLSLMLLLACSPRSPQGQAMKSGRKVVDLDAGQARALIRKHGFRPGFVLLDVRTAPEYRKGHIKGARNIDVTRPGFRKRVALLSRSHTILVYCLSGARSLRAITVLRRLGFRKLYHLACGFLCWQDKGFPVVR